MTQGRSDDEIRADLAVIARVQHPMDQPSVVMLLAADVPALLAERDAYKRELAAAQAKLAAVEALCTKAEAAYWTRVAEIRAALAAASGVSPDQPNGDKR